MYQYRLIYDGFSIFEKFLKNKLKMVLLMKRFCLVVTKRV